MNQEIKTFVFFDLEGTGLTDNPRITEISLLAIHRTFLEDAFCAGGKNPEERNQYLPRIVNKLTVCMYPMKVISAEAANMTGLYNNSLLNQKDFDPDLVSLMTSFMNRLEPPVCLVSHNGFRFDFPLLKAELGSIGCDLPADILCLDTWEMFRSLDGFPVPDTSSFLNKKTIIPSKKKISTSQDLASADAKRKKRAESAIDRDVVDDEIFPLVQQLFSDASVGNKDCDLVQQSFLDSAPVLEYQPMHSPLSGNSESYGTKPPRDLECTNSPLRALAGNLDKSESELFKDTVSSENVMMEEKGKEDVSVKEKFPLTEGPKEIVSQMDKCAEHMNNEKMLSSSSESLKLPGCLEISQKNKNVVSSEEFLDTKLINQKPVNSIVFKGRPSYHHKNFFQKRPSYRLADIHFRVVGCYPSGCHRAEDDCLALARIFMFTPRSTHWADGHAVPFSAFSPLYHSSRKHLERGQFPIYH